MAAEPLYRPTPNEDMRLYLVPGTEAHWIQTGADHLFPDRPGEEDGDRSAERAAYVASATIVPNQTRPQDRG